MKNLVVNQFKSLFSKPVQNAHLSTLLTDHFPALSVELLHWLEERYTDKDVFNASKDMGPLKALGSDSF